MTKKVLLADDSVTIRKVARITLKDGDFELTTVDNGDDAIKKAREIKPDIVIADIVMPGKNGYEVCEEIKKDPALKNTAVLLLATSFEGYDETKGAKAGADGHITKPFDAKILLKTINDLAAKDKQPL